MQIRGHGLRERVLRAIGMGDLYETLSDARASVASARTDNARLTSALRSADLARANLSKWLSDARASVASARTDNARLTSALETANNERARLASALTSATLERDKLSEQMDDLLRQLSEATKVPPPEWPEIERCLLLHLTPGDVFFDIGANQGIYTRLCAGIAREVHAFEPHPAVYTRLRATVQEPNVTLANKAVADRVGMVEFNIDIRPDMNGVASSLMELFDLTAKGLVEKVQVEATTVDYYCAATGAVPTFLKVDVEGAEPLVIAGAAETIQLHRPKIIFEFWEEHWLRFEPTFEALERAGYYLVRVADGADASRYYRAGRYEGGVDILALPLP